MQDTKPQHPSRQELIDLFVEILPEARAEEIREHLSDCPECTRQFLELTRLPDDAPPLAAAQTDRAWQRLEAAIDAEENSDADEKKEDLPAVLPFERKALPAVPPPIVRSGHPTWQLLAATIAGAAIGLISSDAVLLKPEPIRATEETVLTHEDFTDRGNGEPRAVSCPGPGGAFEWRMSPELGDDADRKKIFAEIRTAAGKTIDLQEHPLDSAGDLKLIVPRSRVSDGKYQLLLRLTKESDPIEVFGFSISCP